jgi:hypothetical protein
MLNNKMKNGGAIMDYEYRTAFIGQILGPNATVSNSKDDKAVNVTNEIADGISLGMTFRPSNSAGGTVDVKVDSEVIRHVSDNSTW